MFTVSAHAFMRAVDEITTSVGLKKSVVSATVFQISINFAVKMLEVNVQGGPKSKPLPNY